MSSILLHCCCGPCATYVVEWFHAQEIRFGAYWFNPNIHPFTEHQKRLESMQLLSEREEFPLMIDEGYEMVDYFRAIVGHEGERCGDCYRLRLEETAQAARQRGYDAFTTTLLISPYQDHELLRHVAEDVASENGIEFYYRDFREGFRQGQQKSKQQGLYQQKYCGCIYSEWERYDKAKFK